MRESRCGGAEARGRGERSWVREGDSGRGIGGRLEEAEGEKGWVGHGGAWPIKSAWNE